MPKLTVDLSELKMWQLIASGMTSACVAEFITMPLDTIKVQMQVYQGQYSSNVHAIKTMVNKDGVTGLWKGTSAGILRQMFFGTIRLFLFDYMNGQLRKSKGVENITLLDRVGMGVVAGAVGMMVGNPTDVIKVRMQSDSGHKARYKGLKHAAQTVLKEEGIMGFYHSLPVNVFRNSFVVAIELAGYDQVKIAFLNRELMEDAMPLHFVSSFIAGFISTVLSSPVDVVKSNFMNGKILPNGKVVPYKTFGDAVKRVYIDGGIMGYFRGFNGYLPRVISWNIIMFIVREQMWVFFYNNNRSY